MGNSYGRLFNITTFGESHGEGLGVVIDGCPPQIEISTEEIQFELDRRRPGQSKLVTQRMEKDLVRILSGVFEGKTLGTPIMLLCLNEDTRTQNYEDIKENYRPSHADYTTQIKYGFRDWRGGGRSSARETIGRVAAGAIAKKILKQFWNVEILAWVQRVHDIEADAASEQVTLDQVEATPTRCPDPIAAELIEQAIILARKEGDSLGGVIKCSIRNTPIGWGEPVFDKLEADLAKSMLSLPASKGFEIGSGFGGSRMRGSEHNDEFYTDENGRVRTRSNFSGGIQGGISNGEEIYFQVAFKPTATLLRPQQTVNMQGEDTIINPKGRHDPCVLPRAVPMVEAMAALTLVDHAMLHDAQNGRVKK